MPATNISQIRNTAGAVQTAALARLTAVSVPAFQQRAAEDLPDTYVWPIFTRGGASGHLFRPPAPIGGYEYDIWPESVVSIELFCPRVNSEPKVIMGVYDRLEELAVRVEHAFSGFVGRDALNALMPYHSMDALIPLAEQRGFDEDRKLDRHVLSWRGTLGVRPAAWPADPAAYVLA